MFASGDPLSGDEATVLNHEVPLLDMVNLRAQSMGGGDTYSWLTDNPVEISLGRTINWIVLERTSFHPIFVSKLYFPGRSFLHFVADETTERLLEIVVDANRLTLLALRARL
jgi:hypothetical protein